MEPHCVGIIGGAGPQAGVFLLERLFNLAGKKYGCHRDFDFPKVFLISFPFSEMLCPGMDADRLKKELSDCLRQLRQNGASILAIACNTLHAFLDEKDDLDDLIHLPRSVAEEVALLDPPLVLCTSTSAQFGLHRRFFPCYYPDLQLQKEVDEIIDQILKGTDRSESLDQLKRLIQKQSAKTVVLGCTELSLFSPHLSILGKVIIDPLEVAVGKILQKSFLCYAR